MRPILNTVLLLTFVLVPVADAAICPNCGVDHSLEAAGVSTAQKIAQQRADYMAARGYKGHPPQSVGNWSRVGSFEGVGWASGRRSKASVPTCTPGKGRQLVGDAIAFGRGGSYRVRIWR